MSIHAMFCFPSCMSIHASAHQDAFNRFSWRTLDLQLYVDKNEHCLPTVPAGHTLYDMVLCPTVEQTRGGNAAH